MRCRETYQGDRCRKGLGHDSRISLHPDPWHEGLFSRWDSQKVEPLRPPPRVHRSDLQSMKRALQRAQSPLTPKEERRYLLEEVIKFGKRG